VQAAFLDNGRLPRSVCRLSRSSAPDIVDASYSSVVFAPIDFARRDGIAGEMGRFFFLRCHRDPHHRNPVISSI